MVQQFRKKPVTVEAMQFKGTTDSMNALTVWSHGAATPSIGGGVGVATRMGRVEAESGDWVVKEGDEFYPLRAALFAMLYEPVEAA